MRSILIVHQGAIGDFILSLPALEALHRFFPEAEFTFLGYPNIIEIIRARPYFREVLDCNSSRWTPLYVQGGELTSTDRDSLLPNDSAYVFGRSSIQPLVENLANNLVMSVYRIDPFPGLEFGSGPAEYQCLQLEKVGIPAIPPPRAIIAPQPQDILEAHTFIRQNLSSKGRLVLLHPGSGSRKKLWTPIGWLSVIRRLSSEWSLKLALLEGPADSEIVSYLRARLETITPFSILKNWRLGKLAAVMSKSSLYLGNDSGITHLAAACDTPTVALFGPTDPRIWAPLGPQVKIIRWQGEGMFNATQGGSAPPSGPPPEAEIVHNQAREWLRI
jgi:ADP-heptose:LPS heptosyltransferase